MRGTDEGWEYEADPRHAELLIKSLSLEQAKPVSTAGEDEKEWKLEEEAEKLMEDALMLERIGCFGLVLEKVPAKLAKEVAEAISIPVIGIGAGNGVDGQVLVTHDMIGMTHEFNPRFLRRYLDLYKDMTGAFENYISDVKSGDFPSDKEQY